MTTQTLPFDPADYLDAEEDQIELLRDAFASGEAAYVVNAIGVVARARNVSKLARDVGMTRAGIYKAFGAEGDPKLSTVLGVLSALGIKLSVEDGPGQASPRPEAPRSGLEGRSRSQRR